MLETFKERAELGEQFAVEVFNFLKNQSDEMIRHVVRAGIEHGELRGALEDIRADDTPMARRLRFNPDGMIYLRGRGFRHLEAKASENIERAPYEWYMRYEENGEPVFLVFAPKLLKNGQAPVYICRIRDLALVLGQTTVAAYPAERRHPVFNDWICPRGNSAGVSRGSGTPYREIDIRNSSALRFATAKLIGGRIVLDPDFLAEDTVQRADRGKPAPDRHRQQRDAYIRAVHNWIDAYHPPAGEIEFEAAMVMRAFDDMTRAVKRKKPA